MLTTMTTKEVLKHSGTSNGSVVRNGRPARSKQKPNVNRRGEHHKQDYTQDHRVQLVSVLDYPNRSVVTEQEPSTPKTQSSGSRKQLHTNLIQKIQPRTIIHLGSSSSALIGSSLFFSKLLKTLVPEGSHVLSIDCDCNDGGPSQQLAEFIGSGIEVIGMTADTTDFGALVKQHLGEDESSHPWIVVAESDCPLDCSAVISQVRLYGTPGDYLVFEDAAFEPYGDVSFTNWKKRRQERCTNVLEVMCLFTPEFMLDTAYTNDAGFHLSGGTVLPNGVFSLCDPQETVNTALTYDDSSELNAATIDQHLKEHGHALFRASGDMKDLPFEEIKHALGLMDVNDYSLGIQKRSPVQGDSTGKFVGVTAYSGSNGMYPHHEMHYGPNPPSRILFLCGKAARVGGETTIFDGVQAWKVLPTHLKERIQNSPVVYRREMHSSANINATGLFLGVSWQSAFKVDTLEEAKARAESAGYNLVLTNEKEQTLVLDYEHIMHCETTGGTALMCSAHSNNAWSYKRMDGAPAIKSVHWKDSGEELSDTTSLELAMAYAKARVCFKWACRGDFLVLDNNWFAHGRGPFLGARQVFAIMGLTEGKDKTKL